MSGVDHEGIRAGARFLSLSALDTPEQLFPDTRWNKLSDEQKILLAKYRIALVYLSIGNQYLKTSAPAYASVAFDMACSELDDCCKIAPAYQQFTNLREKCRFMQVSQF